MDAHFDLPAYNRIAGMTASMADIEDSLLILSRMLYAHHGVKPIILIDEYDVPIHNGSECGYCSEITRFFGNFLSAGLNGNRNLYFAVLMSAMSVVKSTGPNNLGV